MEGHLLMSAKERRRKSVFDRVVAGEVTLRKAAELLDLSYRQCRRAFKRYREQGDSGLVHLSRGRPSSRRYPERFKQKVLRRYEDRYKRHKLGPTLAAEKLAGDGFVVDHETLRRWLMAAGHWQKKRKRSTHRSARTRRSRFGELVQLDGSHHRWFGPERERACLMSMVDDATNQTGALTACEETTEAAMRVLWDWIERYGIPESLYTDRKNVYLTDREPTLEEQLEDREPTTAFGRACEKLGIKIIAAYSPQAKGRVERRHGVFQDRFQKELALRGITRIETANKLLQNGFLEELNAKFTVTPIDPVDAHRPLPADVVLEDIFCYEELRTLQNDWTITYKNRRYQIMKDNSPLPRPKDKVLVRERLDGSLHLLYKDKPLTFERLKNQPSVQHAVPASEERPMPPSRSNGPGRSPWKQNCIYMLAETGKKKK